MAMLIDSVLIYVVMRRVWRWRRPVAMLIVIPLLAIDVALLSANVIKIPEGGWFPLLIGAVVFTLLTTWKKGRMLLMQRLNEDSMPLDVFIDSIGTSPPPRVPGTAVFLTSTADRVPHANGAQSLLVGTCPELTRNHIEVRGLGLINVGDLFGISATRASKRVELIVQLERWESGREYDRLGLDTETQSRSVVRHARRCRGRKGSFPGSVAPHRADGSRVPGRWP